MPKLANTLHSLERLKCELDENESKQEHSKSDLQKTREILSQLQGIEQDEQTAELTQRATRLIENRESQLNHLQSAIALIKLKIKIAERTIDRLQSQQEINAITPVTPSTSPGSSRAGSTATVMAATQEDGRNSTSTVGACSPTDSDEDGELSALDNGFNVDHRVSFRVKTPAPGEMPTTTSQRPPCRNGGKRASLATLYSQGSGAPQQKTFAETREEAMRRAYDNAMAAPKPQKARSVSLNNGLDETDRALLAAMSTQPRRQS